MKQPARKAGFEACKIMKTQILQANSAAKNAKAALGVPPTIEEIPQCAHADSLTRGGATGNELNDWLRAKKDLNMTPDGRWERRSSLSTQGERNRHRLATLGAVLLVMLLNGCASVATSTGPERSQYNPNTGYPAVGGPSFGSF